MKTWRRDSIGTTIVLSVVVAMVLGFALHEVVVTGLSYLGLPLHQVGQAARNRDFAFQLPARIASLAEVLDVTPRSDRQATVAGSKGFQFQVELFDTPLPGLANGDDRAMEMLHRRIETLLKAPHLIVAARYPVIRASISSQPAVRGGLKVEVQLTDGQWLVVTSPVESPFPPDPVAEKFSQASFAAWLAVSAILAIMLSVFITRRLASPLSQLAAEVERIGGNGDSPPLALRGPRELQVTIAAINRMQERLRRFVADRTQMLAAMSHDLRTPLTRLKLRLELLGDEEQAQKMIHELDTMMAMVESTLSFAQDDTRREPRILVDLSVLVEGICEDAADAGAAVTFSGPSGVTFLCRPTALRRAITNLVDNAIRYGKGASVHLFSEPNRIVLTIEDEGPGIPPSLREKVFDPFYRVECSRNPATGGVGLGLSVARSTVREHGGDITLANRKGGGLSVRLELPTAARMASPAPERIECT